MNEIILDFRIRPIAGDNFRVEVFERSQSQPLAASSFDYRLSSFTEYELKRLDFDDKDPQARVERLREFGSGLYRKLFTTEVEQVWRGYRDCSGFLTLCLRIAKEARGLEALPWESLCDGEEFLAAGAKTGVSRLPLDIPPQEALPPVPLPIRMLAFVASPLDLPDRSRLNIEREQEILLEAINAPAGQGRLQVDFEDEAKPEILESSLDAGYHVLHFTGHGISPDDGGGLLLEDAEGKRRPIGVDEFLQSLEKGRGALRLAMISGCQTARTLHTAGFRDLARELASHRIPAVLAMQFSISDRGGLKLAETLYPKLIEGKSLEVALAATRRVMMMSDDPYLQADALAAVLIASNGQCLQSTAAPVTQATPANLDLDTSFYLGPLPQLGFSFYGRRREYRRLRDGLLERGHRAAIIHGIGGIGKTSLVSHAASRLKKRFRGVYAFDCSGGQLAPERILLELHRYFELQGVKSLERFLHQPMEPEMLAQIVAKLLVQWPLLLIFDNFESQLDEREEGSFRIADENLRRFLTTLVKATATGSRFLITTRYLFDLDERLADVFSLPLDDLSRPEVFSLMLRLPRLAAASYQDKQTAYETFGGHPFALAQLDKHCQVRTLGEALQDAKAIHTRLREHLAIELNYNRLSERGRELLNRLAAFRQPVSREAVEWVIGEKVPYGSEVLQQIDQAALPDELKALSDEELIVLINRYNPERRHAMNTDQPVRELIEWGLLTPVYEDDEPRFLSVHGLVRDFCRDQQQGETWRVRLRDAAAFYTNQTGRMPVEMKTPATVWSGEMEAFELLMEAMDFVDAAPLLAAVDPLLNRWGFGRHVERQYHRLLDKVDGRNEAMIRHNLAIALQDRGNYDEALTHYQRSLKIAEDLGDIAVVSMSLHQIGILHQARGNYEEALSHYQRSLKMAEDLSDVAGVSRSLHQIGMLHQARGNYEEALSYYQRSLKIAEDLDDIAGVSRSLHQIGSLHQDRGNYEEALSHYQRSLKIAEDLDDIAGVSMSLHNIGILYQDRGNYDEALTHYQRSLKMAEDLSDVAAVSSSLHQIGNLHYLRGNYEEALSHYQRSLKMAEDLGNIAGVASSRSQMGSLMMELGQYEQAFTMLVDALSTFTQLQSPDAGISVNVLRNLRGIWGAQEFDAAWQQTTGEAVPEWIKETND